MVICGSISCNNQKVIVDLLYYPFIEREILLSIAITVVVLW